MMYRKLVVFIGLLWLAPQAAVSQSNAQPAAPVEVFLISAGESELPCTSGVVKASALDAAGEPSGKISVEVKIPGSAKLPLGPGTWKLSVDAGGCWTPETTAAIRPGPATDARISVWPLTPVKGELRTGRGVEIPEKIDLEFSPSFADESLSGPEGRVTCPVGSNDVFLCRLPAAKLDLRIRAHGFAPRYIWKAQLDPDRALDLKTVPLIIGASLSGWLASESETKPNLEGLSVTIAPQGLAEARSQSEERLREAMTSKAGVHENGFFQFHSVDAGEYILKVESPRYSPATVEVLVVEGASSELRHPIVLRPPMKAEFVVDPPIDYYQKNWSLELVRVDRYRSHFAQVAEGEVSPSGWFEAKPVSPSLHLVKLKDSLGQEVLSKMIDLSKEPLPIALEVGMVPVEGRVLLGDDPLEAEVWFGGQYGATNVEIRSDEEGHYRAILPRSGSWRVEIQASEPTVRRKLTGVEVEAWDGGDPVSVDLTLPNTKVVGVVREEDGRPPQSVALVYAVKGTWDRHVSIRVERSGEFEIVGLDEGLHEIYAESGDGRSETLSIDMQEDEESSVELTLRRREKVVGQVVSESGRPIPGASVVIQPATQPYLPTRTLSTDGDGRFEGEVLADTQAVNLTVASPGRTLGVFRKDLDPGRPMVIVLPAQGGRLTIDLGGRRLNEIEGVALAVFRDGVPFAENEVLAWASINRDETVEDDSPGIPVPGMAPGAYEVCLVPIASYPQWLLGYRDGDACDGGGLGPLSDLTVDLSEVE